MAASDYFPGIDRVVRVARTWPRIFAEEPGGTLPVSIEGERLVVLCAGNEPLAMVRDNAEQIVRLLNRLLDGDDVIASVEAVQVTRTEMFLARDMLAIKTWLMDFNVGI
ncbi:MAG: hypothetical protein QOG15_985 [Solirubrobacteraceae bacterium]|jgi:hypothetical protein|nr:hypothetical protein [Solirubrobacteraceae bacterium]